MGAKPTLTDRTQWNGQPIQVTSRLVPRFLWQTASIDVFVDGQRVLQTGGQFKFVGTVASQFTHDGKPHNALLNWGRAFLFAFPVELLIDGDVVLKGRIHTRNWPLGFVPVALVAFAYLLIVYYGNS
jgi:hypothetical protein